MNIEEAVRQYISLCDKIKEREAQHKEELAPLKDKKLRAENAFLAYLKREGSEHTATAYGTVYQGVSKRATVADWKAVLDYIQATKDFDILEARVNAKTVHERLEDGTTIPGVNFNQHAYANVRRK